MDLELDAFECPICLTLFQGSIFQCKNGHVVCDACRLRINETCPSCRDPIGDIRCRALENAIAGMAFPCAYSGGGCTQLLKLKERPGHEAFHCLYAPFVCPLRGCAYSGMLLYDHIHDAHAFFTDYVFCFAGSESMTWTVSLQRSRPFMVLLDPEHRRVFLLLNGGGVRWGRLLSVVCLGQRPEANQLLEYKLKVGGAGGEHDALSLSACSVPCMRRWTEQHPTDMLLFVPDAYWISLDSIVVNVHVQESTANIASGRLTTPRPDSEVDRCPDSKVDGPCPQIDGPCPQVDSPCPQVDTYRRSLACWLRHHSPKTNTLDPLLVLPVLVFSAIVMLALAWKTSATPSISVWKTWWDMLASTWKTSATPSVIEKNTLWDMLALAWKTSATSSIPERKTLWDMLAFAWKTGATPSVPERKTMWDMLALTWKMSVTPSVPERKSMWDMLALLWNRSAIPSLPERKTMWDMLALT